MRRPPAQLSLDIEQQIGKADYTLAFLKDEIKAARRLRRELKQDIKSLQEDRLALMKELNQLARQRDALALP